MKIIRSMILKRITTFALLLAMVAGMATALGRKADAGAVPNGYYRVTMKCYNKTSTKTYDIGAGPYAYYNLPNQTSDQYGSFKGWKEEGTTTVLKGGSQIYVGKNRTFIALWSTQVLFRSYNGTILSTKNITTGDKYSLPSAPARRGYVFIGWYYGNQKITSDTICYVGTRHDVTARYRKMNSSEASDSIDEVLKGMYDPDSKRKSSLGSLSIQPADTSANYGYVAQSSNTANNGICTHCAIANLLNRRSVLDTGKCSFIFEKHVLPVVYPNAIQKAIDAGELNANNKSSYTFQRFWTGSRYKYAVGGKYGSSVEEIKSEMTFKGNNGVTYTLVMKDVHSTGLTKAKLKELLDAHPEGIVIHSYKDGSHMHAAVVTGYKGDTFYVVDTGSHTGARWKSKGQTLGATYITDFWNNNVNDCLAHVGHYWYVK